MAFFSKDYLDFFKELAANNNKDWFDANRKRYEQSVKRPFTAFVEHLIEYFQKHEPRLKDLESSACIFRINRDIRFSKDKTPYKLFCSAVIAPNGKKSSSVHGIYFEFGPEALRVYGGIYEADKDDVYAVREGIVKHLKSFQKLKANKTFTSVFGTVLGEKNKIIPVEFREAAVQEELIFNKQWYFMTELDAEEILAEHPDELLEKCYLAGKPFEQFFNQFIQRT